MKLIYKGTLGMGYSAKVFMDFNNMGSSVEYSNGEDPYCIVKIGCAFSDWTEVFDGIMHEMLEFHMMTMELAYQRWHRAGCDTGDVWFHFNHGEYSEMVSRAAQSIMMFLDAAKKEYDEFTKK